MPSRSRPTDTHVQLLAPAAYDTHAPVLECGDIWTHCTVEKENYWPPHRRQFVQCVIPGVGAQAEVIWLGPDGRRERRNLKPGEVWLVPSGLEQEVHWRRRATLIMLCGDTQLVREVAGEDLKNPSVRPLAEYADCDPSIGILAMALAGQAGSRTARDQRLLAARGTTLFLAIIRAHFPGSGTDEKGIESAPYADLRRRVDRYIRAHLSEPFSLPKLAAAAHMSRWHLCRVFKVETTLTPRDYFNRCRVIRAHALLAVGGHTQTQVMHELGFTELGHFRRVFKKHLNVEPRQVIPKRKTQ